MKRPRKIRLESDYIFCSACGDTKVPEDFYQSSSPLYKFNNSKMVFCKNCVFGTYDKYFKLTGDIRNSVYMTCLKFDIPFSSSDYEGMLKHISKKTEANPFRIYMTKINSLGSVNGKLIDFEPAGLFMDAINTENSDVYEEEFDIKTIENKIEITQADLEVKDDVIRMMGYDPFAGNSKFDQKFLYNELMPFLDEDTIEDAFKLSQILQLVNNNNQIRKMDLAINTMSSSMKSLMSNQGDIKSLTETKNKIVMGTDKIAKENAISVKNRGDKKAGKSTLSYLMKQYRELGFEDAEQDYYDQNKAYGMKLVADISAKSILDQLQLDENDYTDMIKTQRELIQNIQQRIDDLEEENRVLNVELDRLKSE